MICRTWKTCFCFSFNILQQFHAFFPGRYICKNINRDVSVWKSTFIDKTKCTGKQIYRAIRWSDFFPFRVCEMKAGTPVFLLPYFPVEKRNRFIKFIILIHCLNVKTVLLYSSIESFKLTQNIAFSHTIFSAKEMNCPPCCRY